MLLGLSIANWIIDLPNTVHQHSTDLPRSLSKLTADRVWTGEALTYPRFDVSSVTSRITAAWPMQSLARPAVLCKVRFFGILIACSALRASSRNKLPVKPLRALTGPPLRRAHGFASAAIMQPINKGESIMSKNATKPAAKVSMYPITAAIWRNENEGRAFYSATFERSYRDDAGNWKSTSTFNSGDLLLLAKCADMAHTEITKLRANDRQANETDE